MTHVIFHTFWGYLMVIYVMQMERFSFPREYIRDVFGRETSCFLFGLIFYLTVPVLCVLQNSLIMIVVNIRSCKEGVSPSDKDNWLTPTLFGQLFSTLSEWLLSCHTIFPLPEVVQRRWKRVIWLGCWKFESRLSQTFSWKLKNRRK